MSMTNTPSPGSGRAVLLLIAGIPLTMILAASWLWYFVVAGDLDIVGTLGTANQGTLVQPPRQLSDTPFYNDVGVPFAWQDVEPRWTMLVVSSGDRCDTACERRLYITRQIHIAMGKEFNRIRRVMLTDQPSQSVEVDTAAAVAAGAPADIPVDLPGFAAQAHNGLLLLSTDAATLAGLAPETKAEPGQWYLVDPAGWLMMRYTDDLDYKAIIKDLKFLLKNSGA